MLMCSSCVYNMHDDDLMLYNNNKYNKKKNGWQLQTKLFVYKRGRELSLMEMTHESAFHE